MIGHVVGKYKVREQIGEGGMGVVYRAEHVMLSSPAAIKILLPRFTTQPGRAVLHRGESDQPDQASGKPNPAKVVELGAPPSRFPMLVLEIALVLAGIAAAAIALL